MTDSGLGFCEKCKCWWKLHRGGRRRFAACPACGEPLIEKPVPEPGDELRPGVYAQWTEQGA